MIIIKLHGGLGNQMFQYALGNALKIRNKVDVTYDMSYFNLTANNQGISLWKYQLDVFGIHTEKCSPIIHYSYKALEKLLRSGKFYIKEKSIIVDENFLNTKYGYLEGYWQSPEYFENISESIKDTFWINEYPNNINQELCKQIRSTNSVALHVRRGDYLSQSVEGFIDNFYDYYSNAINLLNSKLDNPVFYIFSDDIEWVKHNLPLSVAHRFVNINDKENSYFDMQLMARCKHNIIANSTFSWWGAYLNKNSDKIVISPKNWTVSNAINLIPKSWIRI